jgi:peptidoglycan/xylan/chitin deacetylase (PgdA/CDA1 family)
MSLTPATTPKFFKRLFPNLIWDLPTKEKVIYLTFDDGPTPEITEWTLNTLKQYNAKATFFCIGKNVKDHPIIFSKLVSDGHGIGNHTYNHLKGWKNTTEAYLKNIAKTRSVFQSLLPKGEKNTTQDKFFRPPYGQIKPKQIKALSLLGYKIIMWSVLSVDWDKNVTKEKCAENVINNATSGSIIVFHDSIKASKNMQYALPKVLDYYSKKGYVFKRIPE